jgi:DNA repair ATPase RecN
LETDYSTGKHGEVIMSDKLKNSLNELKNELKRINSENPKLQKLANEVDEALDQTGEVSKALVQSLQDTAKEFEVHHPQLTAIVNNIMTSLSSLGI